MTRSKPTAVLISDVHYNLHTCAVADEAMRLAVEHSNYLQVPLVVAGDLHDTKANLRAECVSLIIDTMMKADEHVYVLVGNHCKTNEKSKPHEHALRFLEDYVFVVNEPMHMSLVNCEGIPYQASASTVQTHISTLPVDRTIVMHQGLNIAKSGHYFKDSSALSLQQVAGRRIISGHYHERQTITLPENGQWDFLGNPYTLGWGEANHPEKGFHVLYSDDSLEFIPTNLRKHIFIEQHADNLSQVNVRPIDIVWLKIEGEGTSLAKLTKKQIAKQLGIVQDFKLDLIRTDKPKIERVQKLGLENTIEQHGGNRVDNLKKLYKDFR